jgi:ABC-type transport system involved in multi-copper enzyme maturation permease subunit
MGISIVQLFKIYSIESKNTFKEIRFPISLAVFMIVFFILLHSKVVMTLIIIISKYSWYPTLKHITFYYVLLVSLPIFISITCFDSLSLLLEHRKMKYIISKISRKDFIFARLLTYFFPFILVLISLFIYLAFNIYSDDTAYKLYLNYNFVMIFFFSGYCFFLIIFNMLLSSFGKMWSILLSASILIISGFYYKSSYSIFHYISINPIMDITVLYNNGINFFMYGLGLLILLIIKIEVKNL